MKMTLAGFRSFAQKAAAAVEELWGDEVVISGDTIAAAVNRSAVGGAFGLGGEIPEAILKVRIQKTNFAGPPVAGKTLLTFEGGLWRVDEFQDSERDGSWALSCVPANA